MLDRLKKILTFNGVAIFIGIAGGIASILTLFNSDWNFSVSIKWIIFICYIFLVVFVILVKFIYDQNIELEGKSQSNPIFRVVKYEPTQELFLIEKTNLLGFDAMVSLFYLLDDFEIELGKAFVSNIQENFIQLKTIDISKKFEKDNSEILKNIKNNSSNELKNIIIKTYVTRNS